ATVFPQDETAIEGHWFKNGEEGLVLGKWLAEDLGVKPGYPVSLSARTREGSYQVIDLEVSGIIDSPNPTINRGTVFLPLGLADQQLDMQGQATEIVLSLAFGSDTKAEAGRLSGLLAEKGHALSVLSWQDMAADFLAISGSKQKSTGMVLLLVFIIA